MANRHPAPNLVTLNLFQGPSGRNCGVIRRGIHPTGRLAAARSGQAAKWALKQVQGDEQGKAAIIGAIDVVFGECDR